MKEHIRSYSFLLDTNCRKTNMLHSAHQLVGNFCVSFGDVNVACSWVYTTDAYCGKKQGGLEWFTWNQISKVAKPRSKT